MKKINNQLFKMSAAGNSFVVQSAKKRLTTRQIQKICSKTDGVGADGYFNIKKSNSVYAWDFYNSDGSKAEMCGNAARCAALYIKEVLDERRQKFYLKTIAGSVGLEIIKNKINVEMPKIKPVTIEKKMRIDGKLFAFRYINTGVPHLVLKADIKQAEKLKPYFKKARMDKSISKSGSNVTIFSANQHDSISAITFERGVEDFTMACGTGAVAAAAVFSGSKKNKVKVSMPGGKMMVLFYQQQPILSGSAKFICKIEVL